MRLLRSEKSRDDYLAADEILFDAAQQTRFSSPVTPLEKPLRPGGFVLLGGVLIIIFSLGFLKVGDLSLWGPVNYAAIAQSAQIHTDLNPAGRGRILDRSGQDLVNNEAISSLVILPYALPTETSVQTATIAKVAAAANLDQRAILETLRANPQNTHEPLVLKNNLNAQETLYLKEILKSESAFQVEIQARRQYLDGPILAHVLGYTGRVNGDELATNGQGYISSDFVGRAGLEATYEAALKGRHGGNAYLTNARGERVAPLGQFEPRPGADLKTTLDWPLQQVAYEALQKGIRIGQSSSGAAIILNPSTGEVLALVSLPTYDNNVFNLPLSPQTYAQLFNNPIKPLFNRVITGVYPPGSTIKMVIGVGALTEKIVSPQYSIFVTGSIVVPSQVDPGVNYVFRDWRAHGWVDFRRALAVSSNVYFYTLAGGYGDIKGLGIERLDAYFEKFGLGQKLNIDLPGEQAGIVPTPAWKEAIHGEPWYIGDTYHQAIGQGDLRVTPLQVAAWTAGVAMGGEIYKPYLVSQVGDQVINPELKYKVEAAAEAFDETRLGLRQAVLDGSARALNAIRLNIAGKTGTAEPGGGLKPHAWFTGFAPFDNPKYVVTVLIEHGGEGSTAAVPVAAEIFKWLAEHNIK